MNSKYLRLENCGSNGKGGDWKLFKWTSNPEKFLSGSSIERYGVALARALGVTPEEPLAKAARELAKKADAVVQVGDDDLDATVDGVIAALSATTQTDGVAALSATTQTDGLPLRDLEGLDKARRSIRGEKAVQESKKVSLQ